MIKSIELTNGKAVSLYNKNSLWSLSFLFIPVGLFFISIGIVFLSDKSESIITGLILISVGLFVSIGIFSLPSLMTKAEQNFIDKSKIKQKCVLELTDNNLIVDNSKNEPNKKVKVYVYDDYVFIVLNQSNYDFYIICNDSFIEGDRARLLDQPSKIASIKKGK